MPGSGVWTYNPWYGMITYMPCNGMLMSPYGYNYWSPYTVGRVYYSSFALRTGRPWIVRQRDDDQGTGLFLDWGHLQRTFRRDCVFALSG